MSYVENALDEATEKMKDPDQMRRARQSKFDQIMRNQGEGPISRFGPDEAMELEQPAPPGSFKDPATLFRNRS